MSEISKVSIIATIIGDSMNDGSRRSFAEGDILTCIETDLQSIETGRTYIIQSNGNTLARRVTRCDGEYLTLTPINPLYNGCELSKSDVQHIYSIEAHQIKVGELD